jgi:hypothetical protein
MLLQIPSFKQGLESQAIDIVFVAAAVQSGTHNPCEHIIFLLKVYKKY